MKYKAIFFDADDTIFDFHAASLSSFRSVLKKLDVSFSEQLYTEYENINSAIWNEFEIGLITQDVLQWERFRRFFEKTGISADAVKAGQLYLENLSQSIYMVDGASEMLNKIADIPKVLVTNGIAYVQNCRYKKAGLEKYFEGIVISEEVGTAKPDSAMFRKAMEFVPELHKKDILMVGDSLRSDIAGALGFGIDSCWFNLRGLSNESNFIPTYTINSISSLLDILGF